MSTLQIKVKREYLNKDACLEKAGRLLDDGLIHDMSRKQLAREIYCHALVHFFSEKTGLFSWVRKYTDPIDLQSGGDKRLRRAVYAASWAITGHKSSKGK